MYQEKKMLKSQNMYTWFCATECLFSLSYPFNLDLFWAPLFGLNPHAEKNWSKE